MEREHPDLGSDDDGCSRNDGFLWLNSLALPPRESSSRLITSQEPWDLQLRDLLSAVHHRMAISFDRSPPPTRSGNTVPSPRWMAGLLLLLRGIAIYQPKHIGCIQCEIAIKSEHNKWSQMNLPKIHQSS